MHNSDKLIVLAIGIIILVILVVAFSQYGNYDDACISSGGKPVYNGKFMECIKK